MNALWMWDWPSQDVPNQFVIWKNTRWHVVKIIYGQGGPYTISISRE